MCVRGEEYLLSFCVCVRGYRTLLGLLLAVEADAIIYTQMLYSQNVI